MKYRITIPALLFIVTVGIGQTLENSKLNTEKTSVISTTKSKNHLYSPLVADEFIPTLHGNIDTVWRHTNPIFEGVCYYSLLAASDGSFYLPTSTIRGGTFTKVDADGNIKWTIDRYNHGNSSLKFYSNFETVAEETNGNIITYGGEGAPWGTLVVALMPKKMVVKPDGTIQEEKCPRELIEQLGTVGFRLPTQAGIVPNEILFSKGLQYDTILSLYSMDTDLSAKKKDFGVNTGMSEVADVSPILPYGDGRFIVAAQGKSIEQPIFHIAFLQYNNDYTFVKKTIVPTNGVSKIVVADNYSLMIASSITTSNSKPLHLRKIDQNGNQLWEKVVDGLQDIPLKVNGLSTTRDGGFIVTGETWLRKSDGSVDYDNETRIGFITKLSSEGEMQWYYTTGRAGMWNRIFCVAEASNGDFVTVCNSGNTSSKVNYEETMEIVRLRPKATSVNEDTRRLENNLTISPNPTNTSFTISGADNILSVKITNSLGMEVSHKSEVVGSKQEIDVSDLSSGIYFVQMRTATGMMTKPIVVRR